MPSPDLRSLRSAIIAAALVLSTQSFSQSQTVAQSGVVTNGHVASWVRNGIIQDAGTANLGNITELGITKNGGRPFCISNTNTRGQYVQMCQGISTSGAYITIDGFNSASAPPFDVIINGVPYPFPSSVPYSATPIRTVSSGTTDAVASPDQNGTIAWNSSSTSAKTETLFACSSLISGFTVTIKDQIGTAATYPITITSASNIDGSTSYYMAFNYQSVTLQCNGGTTSWIVK